MTVYESQDAVQAVMGSILGGWGGCGICCVDREHLNAAADVSLSQQRRSALSSVRPAVVGRK
ncbi:MAG: hypothetical protein V3U11_01575 [Planctomycetota bacterium]